MWTSGKPILRHLHVWGCPAEAHIYNPHENKLDSHTTSGYFIGYPDKSKGYRFYCPNHNPRIVETCNAKFIENGEVSGSNERHNVEINKIRETIRISMNVPLYNPTLNIVLIVKHDVHNNEQHMDEDMTHEETNSLVHNDQNESQEPANLRKSQRERRSAIPDDYMVYLQESDLDVGTKNDPVSFS